MDEEQDIFTSPCESHLHMAKWESEPCTLMSSSGTSIKNYLFFTWGCHYHFK